MQSTIIKMKLEPRSLDAISKETCKKVLIKVSRYVKVKLSSSIPIVLYIYFEKYNFNRSEWFQEVHSECCPVSSAAASTAQEANSLNR